MTSIDFILNHAKMFIFRGEINDERYPLFGHHFCLASGRPSNLEIPNYSLKIELLSEKCSYRCI